MLPAELAQYRIDEATRFIELERTGGFDSEVHARLHRRATVDHLMRAGDEQRRELGLHIGERTRHERGHGRLQT
jgi:hypothetical protein